ncbi:MAG: ABC transporter ATP-binding protein [Candidatus Sumerlaeaceae bacterium]|nr:ABC transporter ATP-binding protein [Candidatus Sumerlaeaceae bacterium]
MPETTATPPAPAISIPGGNGNRIDPSRHLLAVEELKTYFHTSEATYRSVDGVTFVLDKGKTLGIVGESGCGKSVTSLSILRLIQEPPGRIEGGSIHFNNVDLLKLSEREMRKIRGNKISMIFQEPMTSLNPVFTVGDQIGEVFRVHKNMSRRAAVQEAIRMLELVKIPSAAQRVHDYPHQMSGGMRQRVMIAMALACNPDLLIADEPTTALDVTVQAQILNLMEDLKAQFESSIIMITHDLGVIAEISDHVAVMYAGQIVEYADVKTLFANPLHPYTHGLMKSIPRIDEIRQQKKLYSIEGNVPDPSQHPVGCRFHPRCPYATLECKEAVPELKRVNDSHTVRCIHWDRIAQENKARGATL